MTPKEKAEELFQLYLPFVESGHIEEIKNRCKRCALIVVKEIIEFMEADDFDSDTCYWENHSKMQYWQEVKQEIANL